MARVMENHSKSLLPIPDVTSTTIATQVLAELRCDAHLSAPKARRSPPQPGEHEDAEAEETAARVASRAGSLLCHPAPSPCPTSCTPRTACAGVPHARGVGDEAAPEGRNGTRAARAFPPRDTPTPCPHTRPSQLTHGPPCAAHPPLPRGMHAVGQRVPSVRLVACACSALAFRHRCPHARP